MSDDIKALKEALSRLRTEVNPAKVTPEEHKRIVADCHTVSGWCNQQGLSVLLERLEAAERDAARYAWLCSGNAHSPPSLWDYGIGFACDIRRTIPRGILRGKLEIDAAIDAAMKKEPQQ